MAVTRIWDADASDWVVVGSDVQLTPPEGISYGTPIYFPSSTTFTKAAYPGASAFQIECQGGGGGSGGCAATTAGQIAIGGPGCGGSYARSIVPVSDIDVTEAIVVGAGGAAGAANGSGGDGGDSSFDTISGEVRGTGGSLGSAGGVITTFPQSGGGVATQNIAGSVGDVVIEGDEAIQGWAINSTRAWNGVGGASFLAGNQTRGVAGGDATAGTGRSYGGGAYGGLNMAAFAAKPGAAGGPGLVIVTPIYPVSLDAAGGWTLVSPTLSGVTLGIDGENFLRYARVGNLVSFHGYIFLGSGGSVSASIGITLPIANANTMTNEPFGRARFYDTSASQPYEGTVVRLSAATVQLSAIDTSGAAARPLALTSTVPFTWGVTDVITYSGQYEVA